MGNTKLRKKFLKVKYSKLRKISQEIFVFRCSEKLKKTLMGVPIMQNNYRDLYFAKIADPVLKTVLNLVFY